MSKCDNRIMVIEPPHIIFSTVFWTCKLVITSQRHITDQPLKTSYKRHTKSNYIK